MRIGVDLGGTKIEALALDHIGHEVARQRIATPRGDYRAIVAAIAELVEEVEASALELTSDTHGDRRPLPVGVGTPGIISPATGLVKNANTTELNGHPLDRDLSERLQREVRVANDANCFALSETVDGAVTRAAINPEASVVFGVILGTGTGGGIVVRSKLLQGVDRIGGEWGHNPLPWMTPEEFPGPSCWCGQSGCIETFLSGPAIAREHAARFGEELSAQQIAEAAERGNANAQQTTACFIDRLARALASVINLLNPDAIVLGGGLSNMQELYTRVPRSWTHYVFSDTVSTRLLRPRHGDSSGVRGAAWLADQ